MPEDEVGREELEQNGGFLNIEEAGVNVMRLVEQWNLIDNAFNFDQ